MALQRTRVLVRDTITNRSDKVIGILLSNHINTRGMKDAVVTRMANPTVFVGCGGTGMGLIALDDLYQLQQHNDFADGIARVCTDHFGLAKGASYTIQWAVYPVATSDYYDFINQVRTDEGLHGHVEGAFSFVSRRTPPPPSMVAARHMKYASIGCLGKPLDNPALPLEGIEFVEYPKESAALKRTFAETKAKYPGMKVMFHVAHSLYMCNNPRQRWPDSLAVDAGGRQLHYGPNSMDYYGRYISSQHFDQGYRWWLFYPTTDNSFGKAMIAAMDTMLDEIGATGMWADGYISGYVRGGYSYDRWDGHSVTIDPKTKLVVRKKTCVPYVALPVLKKVARMISDKGGVLVSNGQPGPRSYWKEKTLTSCETGGGDARPISALHLGRTVTPLGNQTFVRNMRDFYRDMLAKLDYGALYFWYGGGAFPERKTLVEHMYPITFETIHAGTVRGRERIVTKKSGVYGWHGDAAMHKVHLYDARGALVRNDLVTTVDAHGVRTEVALRKDQSAVIERLPVTLRTSVPVNVHVHDYGAKGVRLALNGRGRVRLCIESGAFAIAPGSDYAVTVNGKAGSVTASGNTLVVPLDLAGPANVGVQRHAGP